MADPLRILDEFDEIMNTHGYDDPKRGRKLFALTRTYNLYLGPDTGVDNPRFVHALKEEIRLRIDVAVLRSDAERAMREEFWHKFRKRTRFVPWAIAILAILAGIIF